VILVELYVLLALAEVSSITELGAGRAEMLDFNSFKAATRFVLSVVDKEAVFPTLAFIALIVEATCSAKALILSSSVIS
jgi:hypothetical protein